MQLQALVATLGQLDERQTIYAKRPWAPTCDAESTLSDVAPPGLEYFLEVHVANEVVGVFDDEEVVEDTVEQRTNLLIYYAENDAFPEWVA